MLTDTLRPESASYCMLSDPLTYLLTDHSNTMTHALRAVLYIVV
jgi:hypothetical protein